MSSVFSRKITMSTLSGRFTGEGTPWKYFTGAADVEVEHLAPGVTLRQRKPRSGRRNDLDRHEVFADDVEGLLGQQVRRAVLAVDLLTFRRVRLAHAIFFLPV